MKLISRFIALFLFACYAVPAFAVYTWVRDGRFPADTTAATGFPATTGVQGVAIDGQGKIWIQTYAPLGRDKVFVTATGAEESICVLYVYLADGTQAAFSPLRFVTIGADTDTLGGRLQGGSWLVKNGLGLATDAEGDILATFHDTIYRIDHLNGAGLAKAVYQSGVAATAPAAAATSGDIFAAAAAAGYPVKEYSNALVFEQNVTASRPGSALALAAAASGNALYMPTYSSQEVLVYQRADGASPWSSAPAILQGMACESMGWEASTGYLWASAGSYYNLPNQNPDSVTSYFPNTWYAFDTATGAIMDSIKWHFNIPESPAERPRGIAISATGNVAYVACYPQGGVLRYVKSNIYTHNITFRVNMEVQEAQGSFNPLTDSVFVMGNFNGWETTASQMLLTTTPHVYEYTAQVYYARPVLYNFVRKSGETVVVETIDVRADVVEPGGQLLPTVYFNDQTDILVTAQVTFQADMSALLALNWDPTYHEMIVIGDFNSWAYESEYAAIPVPGNPQLYTFVTSITAPRNSVQSWKFHAYPADDFVNGGLESVNSTFVFTGVDLILPVRAPSIQFVQQITIVAPNGGEKWRAGTVKKITWLTHTAGDVRVEYQSSPGGGWSVATAGTPALAEFYNWTLPALESGECRLRLTNLTDGSVTDESDSLFTITQIVPTAESENNNTANLANWIEYGDVLDAAISPDGDVDYYRFWGAKGDTAEIWGESRGDSSLAGRIILYSSDGTGLYENDGYLNPPEDQRIACILPEDGVYYIRYAFMDNWGTFPNRELIERLEDDERDKLGLEDDLQWTVQGEYRIGLRYVIKGSPVITSIGVYDQYWNSVRFYGYVDPRKESTTAQFEHGPTISYGTIVPAEGGPFMGISEQFVSSPEINGLTAEAVYHMRMSATNSLGTDVSWDLDYHTPPAPEGWERKISGSTRILWDVFFLDDLTGIICGDSTILRTTDGGETWTQLYSGIWTRFKGVEFITPTKGFIMGSYGNLYKTTDAGQSWTPVNSSTGLYLFATHFPNEDLGWIACDAGLIIHSSDGGDNWSAQNSGVGSNLRGVYFLSATTGLVIGEDSTIVRTTDGGATWTRIASPRFGNFLGIHFADALTGVIVGKEDFILRTTDGGLTWTEVSIAPHYYLTDIHFYAEGYAIAVGRDGTILRTSDGGATWSEQQSGTLNDLDALHHAGTHTTIVGANQTILRSADFLSLKSPNGGEVWSPGSVQDIVWWTDLGGTMRIEYRTGSVSPWQTITESASGVAGRYAWTIPGTLSDSCIVRITSLIDNSYIDQSDSVFAIRVTSTQQLVTLNAGWNMISSYIDPPDSTLPTLLLAQLGSTLTIAKNTTGQIYWPLYNINTIGKWKPLQGYMCYVTQAATLTFTGDQLAPESTPIPLAAGWNIVAYLRASPLAAPTALASIASQLTIAKNMTGGIYWPQYTINTIGNMLPGQGYQLYVTAATALTYPANTAVPKEMLAGIGAKALQHFALSNQVTGSSAILLVRGSFLAENDEVGIRTSDGRYLGAGVVQGGQVPITIWGDDEMTRLVDGATSGDRLELIWWSAAAKLESPLKITTLQDGLSGDALPVELTYRNDAILVAGVAEAVPLPREFALRQNYPNPFNPATSIKYELPKESHVELVVYNLRGQAIRTLVNAEKRAGYHDLIWDGRNQVGALVSSGIYFVRMKAGPFVKVVKMSLVK